MASTKEPRPWKVSTRPSARNRVTASRTTVRETEYSSISSASDGSLVPSAREPCEDPRLQIRDDGLGKRGAHAPKVAVSRVSERIRSLSVTPRPGRSGTHIRPSRISTRSTNSGLSHSKCSTQGSVG